MSYTVCVNTPGYLPNTDDVPESYDNAWDARGAFAGALDALRDDGYVVRWQCGDYARLERDADDLGLEVAILAYRQVA